MDSMTKKILAACRNPIVVDNSFDADMLRKMESDMLHHRTYYADYDAVVFVGANYLQSLLLPREFQSIIGSMQAMGYRTVVID